MDIEIIISWLCIGTVTVLWGALVKAGGRWLVKHASEGTNKYLNSQYRDALLKGIRNDNRNSDAILLTCVPVVALVIFQVLVLNTTLDAWALRNDLAEEESLVQIAMADEHGIDLTAEQKELLAAVQEQEKAKPFEDQLTHLKEKRKRVDTGVWVLVGMTVLLAFLILFLLPWAIKRMVVASISANLMRNMSRLEGIVSKDEYRNLCLLDLQAVDDATVDKLYAYLGHLADTYKFPLRVA